MVKPLLLCCDLDRTVLPNGLQPQSPQAMDQFKAFAAHPDVTIAYVTGRNRALTESAIIKWDLPRPAVVATDVGSTIYTIGPSQKWEPWQDWYDIIKQDWNGKSIQDMAIALNDIPSIALQPDDRQTEFKLCYVAPPESNAQELQSEIQRRLADMRVRADVIWSIDETIPIGLIDIVPCRATKLGAIQHIMSRLGFDLENTMFAGDSGNDLPALTSPIKAVLVKNATADVRETALKLSKENHETDTLYLAHGGFHDMNGMYTAGILEGVNHFFPEYGAYISQTP